MFSPLQKRKRSTSKRWLIAVLILAALWLSVSLLPGEESETTLIETVLEVFELVFLTIGAILAARPNALEHLPN